MEANNDLKRVVSELVTSARIRKVLKAKTHYLAAGRTHPQYGALSCAVKCDHLEIQEHGDAALSCFPLSVLAAQGLRSNQVGTSTSTGAHRGRVLHAPAF